MNWDPTGIIVVIESKIVSYNLLQTLYIEIKVSLSMSPDKGKNNLFNSQSSVPRLKSMDLLNYILSPLFKSALSVTHRIRHMLLSAIGTMLQWLFGVHAEFL